MRETVPKEFDFLREARLMRVIAARLKAAGIEGVIVPEPLMALSSQQLLVMQRMPGECTTRTLHFLRGKQDVEESMTSHFGYTPVAEV